MKKLFLLGGGLMASMPLVALAVGEYADSSRIGGIFGLISDILAWVIPILVTIAVIYFIWGVVQYLISGDEEKKKKASGMITRGLIGLFIIVAFWGIIRFFSDSIGVGPEQLNENAIPCVPNPYANPPITCNQ